MEIKILRRTGENAPECFFEKNPLKSAGKQVPIFLFLDFDGTLVPIQGDPAECALSPDIEGALKEVADSDSFRVAVLSGRSLPDIKAKVPIEGLYYGGNHGLDILGPGIAFTHPDAIRTKSLVDKFVRALREKTREIEGALIEDKGFTAVLHYRLTSKGDSLRVRRIFYEILSALPQKEQLTVLRAKKVLEVAPDTAWDKGKAVSYIMNAAKEAFLPVYVGDDLTDETAFRAVGRKGITVRVGSSRRTAANYCLKGQWEILRFLRQFVEKPLPRPEQESPGPAEGEKRT